MWCFRVQTHLVPQPFHPHILFVSQFAISASDSSLIFRSECKDENTHRCRYVLISISLCLSISLGAESFPHSIRGNKAFLLHAFTSSPVFISPPSFKLNFSLACAVLLAALCEKNPNKTAFSLSNCVASTLHLLTTVPMKNTARVSLKSCTGFRNLLRMILSKM